MPVKRRVPKQRRAVPLEAFDMIFACGFDYLNDLSAYGIEERDHDTIRAAWMEHGEAWLADWDGPGTPWALEAFGSPY